MKRSAWGLVGVLWAGTTAVGGEPAHPLITGRLSDGAPTCMITSGLAGIEYRPFLCLEGAKEDKPTASHGRTFTSRTGLDRAYRVEDVRTGRVTVTETLIEIERPNGLFTDMKMLEK